MKIVIDIPDWVYKHIVQGDEEAPDENISIDAIRNGTVLPENHGRLIDADALEGEPYLMSEGNGMYRTVTGYFRVEDAPTIIEGTEGKE